MIKCPRCEYPVDETSRTTCPLCFTPVVAGAGQPGAAPAPPAAGAAPPMPPPVPQAPGAGMTPPVPPMPGMGAAPPMSAAPPQPMAGGIPGIPNPAQAPVPPPPVPGSAPMPGMRVSLTGEVIQDNAPTTPPSYVGGSVPPAGPRPVGPAGPARPSGARPMMREEAPAKSSGGAVLAIVLVLALLGGGGGWWWWNHRTNPKDQAQKFFTAVKALDYKGIYSTMEGASDEAPSAEEFEKKAKDQIAKNPAVESFMKGILGMVEFKVGEATVTGDDATVAVTVSAMGQTQNQALKMKKIGGIWKVSKDNQQAGSLSGFGALGGMGGGGGNGGGMGGFGGFGAMGGGR